MVISILYQQPSVVNSFSAFSFWQYQKKDLLLRDKPRTAAQLAAALTEKGYPCDSQMLEKSLARLSKRGILSVSDGVYRCTSPKLDATPYTENQLLDLVGMTQSTVNGTAFYTAAPPASVSSRGPSGS